MSTDDTRTLRRLWSLREEIAIEAGDDGITMIAPWGEIDLGPDASVVEPELRRLAMGPVDLNNSEPPRRADLVDVLDGITGAVAHSLEQPGLSRARLSVVPIAAEAPFVPIPADPRDTVRLSRLAVIRPWAGCLVVSAPGARHEVVCEGTVLGSLLSRIASSIRVSELSGRAVDDAGGGDGEPCLDAATCQDVEDVLGWLISAGVVQVARADGSYAEDVDPDLMGWAAHELEFDARTRRPGQAATERVRLQDGVRADGIARESPAGSAVALPGGGTSAPTDVVLAPASGVPPFTGAVLATVRLGEVLDRGIRSRLLRGRSDRAAADRARSPSLAWRCELEIYVALDRGELDRDVYRYDPDAHALTVLGLPADAVDDIVAACSQEIGDQRFTPAAILLATSRRAGGTGVPGVETHAAALSQAGALLEVLMLAGRTSGVTVRPAPLMTTEAWAALIDRVWPAEVPVGVCVLDPAPMNST